jgi:hypothetical protein
VRLQAALLCLVLMALSVPVHAWNGPGHMQIALLARSDLSATLQRYYGQLLHHHPRYAQDFKARLPPELGLPEEQAQWLFAWAATWPDLARGQPGYHHGPWHYINLPLHIVDPGPRGFRALGPRLTTCPEARQRLAALAGKPTSGSAKDPADIEQALAVLQATLRDLRAPPSERALALSWLMHLVADAHQPLHSVALFTRRHFTAGDRGGNEITVGQATSLHRLWDDLLGDDSTMPSLLTGVAGLRRSKGFAELQSSAKLTVSVPGWIDESCELSRRGVYVPRVLKAVEAWEQEPHAVGKPDVPQLPSAVLAQAKRAARRRAVQAAARLTALLEQAVVGN